MAFVAKISEKVLEMAGRGFGGNGGRTLVAELLKFCLPHEDPRGKRASGTNWRTMLAQHARCF